MKVLTIVCVLCVTAVANIDGANILGIFNNVGKSHQKLGEVLLKALAAKGHKVTMVSPFPLVQPVPNYVDINLNGFLEMKQKNEEWFTKLGRTNMFSGIKFLLNYTRIFTEETLKHPRVKKLIASKPKFDVIIMDWFLNEALLVFGHIFKAPVIIVSSFGTSEWVNPVVGNPAPYSYVPSKSLTYGDEMTFLQRVSNVLNILLFNGIINYNVDYHNQLLKKYFNDAPEYSELEKNIALVFSNAHYSFESPRPFVPNMIPIGGFHVETPKPLPEDIKTFLDGAKEGVVYFSLGSHVKSIFLEDSIRNEIVNAFAKIPQKVLWKYEGGSIPNKPANVKFGKWLPQNAILAHPNVKAFITHGGLLSTIEAVHHGVPVIGIPLYGDQESNIASAEAAGYAIKLNIDTLNEKDLTYALNEIINNTKYSKNIKKRSELLKDQPLNPRDAAIFWVEHVIRHKGGEHLKNSSTKLNIYQYLLLDVVLFLTAVILGFVIGCYSITKRCVRTIKKIVISHKLEKMKTN